MTMTKFVPAVAAALAIATLPGFAQEAGALPFTQVDGQLELETMGQKLTLPPPDWAARATTPAELSEQVSTRFLEESGQAHLEIYKRGEGEAFWTTLYGARVSNQTNLSLADFRSVVINVYAQSCDPATVALFQLEPDQDDMLPPVGYVCGAYLDGFTAFAGQGEVMVMGFYKSDAGIGMVYQEWRGDAFDAADPASWPVASSEVEAYMARLKSDVTLTAAD
ncbi:hypothetical protein SAMN06295905_2936 [Devosia lucknowensis]|uniref:Uncharacterized protein n=1 Tax=Devosia lucknowensis TaxID=1096929 RepID=A0A1Y6GC49_9HYPH|nr:hypothetical protein [Devosia lucknowensis]SMQ85649.1 hypothetical protein SAMN06295905_2936 [Devosia lucknowensis]